MIAEGYVPSSDRGFFSLSYVLHHTDCIDFQIVDINPETVSNIPSTDFPGHWPGESHEWSLAKFKNVRW